MSKPARDRPTVADADTAVIIPCYNHGPYLAEAVASARAQTLAPTEIVIVDDGSTDPGTREVLDALRASGLRVLTQPNLGLAAARNTGVRATSAAHFVPLDADDRLHPEFLARLQPVLSADPRLGYVYCHARLFGARTGRWSCPPYDPRLLLLHNLSTATALVRRAAFEAVGGYARDMTAGYEDWDFWLALSAVGYHGRCIPRALFEYRQHPSGQSMRDRVERSQGPMLRRIVSRHRALFISRLRLPPEATDDEILAERAAAVALNALEHARLWQVLRIFGGPLVWASPRPSLRLAQALASRAAGWMQRLKALSAWRAYATWRYGRALAISPQDEGESSPVANSRALGPEAPATVVMEK